MDSSLANIVESIKDNSQARLKLIQKGDNSTYLDCIYQANTEDPLNFFLTFPPEKLSGAIDFKAEHPLTIFSEDKKYDLNTSVVELTDDRTLCILVNGLLDPSTLREFFRVNTTTEITASYKTSSQESVQSSWTIHGQTLDLSGSGALALFSDKPLHNENIIIEIGIPIKNTTANGVGHVVHKKQLRNKRWLVAFHFDNISSKHRDAIITYLLSEQRKQLRQNIRTRDL